MVPSKRKQSRLPLLWRSPRRRPPVSRLAPRFPSPPVSRLPFLFPSRLSFPSGVPVSCLPSYLSLAPLPPSDRRRPCRRRFVRQRLPRDVPLRRSARYFLVQSRIPSRAPLPPVFCRSISPAMAVPKTKRCLVSSTRWPQWSPLPPTGRSAALHQPRSSSVPGASSSALPLLTHRPPSPALPLSAPPASLARRFLLSSNGWGLRAPAAPPASSSWRPGTERREACWTALRPSGGPTPSHEAVGLSLVAARWYCAAAGYRLSAPTSVRSPRTFEPAQCPAADRGPGSCWD
jgi:hypothetical protein